MADNKIAFLVPVHTPHFKYARGLIESHKVNSLDEQSDLWFIFTTEEEKEQFIEYENTLVLPSELRNFENNGIINIKKFYGLFKLKDKYDYIIVLDAESLLIKNINLQEVCDDFWNNKILYGNHQPPEGLQRAEEIKNASKRHFLKRLEENPVENENLYLWFNQPCIYKCSTLDDFFEKIEYSKNAANFTWHEFDHYVYMYYLVCYQNFKIDDMEIESNYGICEASLDYIYFKSNKWESINIYMCSQATLNKFDNPKLFIICHLDRDNIWMLRVTNIKVDSIDHRIENEIFPAIRATNEQINILMNKLNNLTEQIYKMSFKYKIKRFLKIFIPKSLRPKLKKIWNILLHKDRNSVNMSYIDDVWGGG